MTLRQPVEIVSVLRRMRGGSQSFLVKGNDGAFYVAKFQNNPQGNRSLINECIAAHLLRALGVSTPDLAILRLSADCIGRSDLYFSEEGFRRINDGLHLGSKCPVNPETVAIFDFLPARLYSRLANLDHLGIVVAFDHWTVNADRRQFIFARRSDGAFGAQQQCKPLLLRAWAIDSGMCFAKNWSLRDDAHYWQTWEPHYHAVDLESTAHGLRLIQGIPESELVAAQADIPREWFSDLDEARLGRMLAELNRRKERVSASMCKWLAMKADKVLAG